MPRPLTAVLLGLGTAVHWLWFFAAGRFDMTVADWPRQSAYFEVLRDAVREGRLPLATAEPLFDMGPRYVANLEAPLGPHTWLFAFAGDHLAIVASAVLLSWIGVYGCFRLARRLDLSAPAFVALTMFIALNGSLVAHLSAGHMGWLGYYALPFVIEALLVMAMAGQGARRAAPALALVLFALLIAGALQVAVMAIALIALCAILIPAGRAAFAWCLVQFAMLSMVRTLPAALSHWRGGRIWIADGYTPAQMLESLMWFREPSAMQTVETTLTYGARSAVTIPWVEFDAYIGVFGVLLLSAFAIADLRRSPGSGEPHEKALRALQWPCVALAILSLDRFYAGLIVAPVSLLTVIRVPSRFLGVAVVVALALAIARLDTRWRARPRGPAPTVLLWAGILAAALQLGYHSLTYSPARAPHFPVTLPAADRVLVDAGSQPGGGVYLAAVTVGGLVSIGAGVWTTRRYRRRG